MANISSKNRDFSNPMYDALGGVDVTTISDNGAGIYEVPLDVTSQKITEPSSAILAPSSVIQKSSPQIHIRHRELDPSTVDSGKDTQKLVEEDKSDC